MLDIIGDTALVTHQASSFLLGRVDTQHGIHSAFVHLTSIGLIHVASRVEHSHLRLWFHHVARVDSERLEFCLIGLLELHLNIIARFILFNFLHLIVSDAHLRQIEIFWNARKMLLLSG